MAAWYSPSSLQAACGPVLELVWSPLLLGRAMGQFVSRGEQVAQSLAKCNSWLSCEFLNTVVVRSGTSRTRNSGVVLVLLPGQHQRHHFQCQG